MDARRFRVMSMLSDFKQFAIKGNVVDLAVGFVLGAAFGKITTSLVSDVIMPLIGFVLGKVAFAMFMLMQQVARIASPPAAPVKDKDCPFCLSKIPIGATKCAHCASELKAA